MKTNEVYFHPCDRSNTEKLYRGETVEQSFLEKIVDSEAFFTFCCLEYSVRRYHYVGIAAEQIVLTCPLLPTRIHLSTGASKNCSKRREVATMLIKEGVINANQCYRCLRYYPRKKKQLNDEIKWIQCENCFKWFHAVNCLNLSEEEYKFYKQEDNCYYCTCCEYF